MKEKNCLFFPPQTEMENKCEKISTLFFLFTISRRNLIDFVGQAIFNFRVSMIAIFSRQLNTSFQNLRPVSMLEYKCKTFTYWKVWALCVLKANGISVFVFMTFLHDLWEVWAWMLHQILPAHSNTKQNNNNNNKNTVYDQRRRRIYVFIAFLHTNYFQRIL